MYPPSGIQHFDGEVGTHLCTTATANAFAQKYLLGHCPGGAEVVGGDGAFKEGCPGIAFVAQKEEGPCGFQGPF